MLLLALLPLVFLVLLAFWAVRRKPPSDLPQLSQADFDRLLHLLERRQRGQVIAEYRRLTGASSAQAEAWVRRLGG